MIISVSQIGTVFVSRLTLIFFDYLKLIATGAPPTNKQEGKNLSNPDNFILQHENQKKKRKEKFDKVMK